MSVTIAFLPSIKKTEFAFALKVIDIVIKVEKESVSLVIALANFAILMIVMSKFVLNARMDFYKMENVMLVIYQDAVLVPVEQYVLNVLIKKIRTSSVAVVYVPKSYKSLIVKGLAQIVSLTAVYLVNLENKMNAQEQKIQRRSSIMVWCTVLQDNTLMDWECVILVRS